MTVSRRDFDHAYESGGAARRAGRSIDTCPRYGMGEDARTLADRWREGYQDADADRAKGKR